MKKLIENLLKEASYLPSGLLKFIPSGAGVNDWGSGKFVKPKEKFKIKGIGSVFIVFDIDDGEFNISAVHGTSSEDLDRGKFITNDLQINKFEKICKYISSVSEINPSEVEKI